MNDSDGWGETLRAIDREGRIVLSKCLFLAIKKALLIGNEMRLNRPYLSTTKRGAPAILNLTKPLLALGYGGLLILALLGNLVADDQTDQTTPAVSPNAGTLPDDSTPPDNSQAPVNPQMPATPLLPQQGVNPYLPFSTSPASAANTQSPQLTAPSLYTTGTNDLSQIATTAALTQAFSQQTASGFYSEPGMSYSYPPIERIRLGPFDLKAALSTNLVSDDNLRTGSQGQKISDTSYGITPAILLQYGAHEGQKGYASVVYTPTITRFFHNPDQNSDDQNVALGVQYPFQRLTLNFSESYSQATGVNTDLNARTTQTSNATTFGGTYDIDDKLSFAASVQEVITSFSEGGGQGGTTQGGAQGQGDKTSSVNTSLSYHLSEKMTVGPSVNVGLDKPDNTKQETFEQAYLGLAYQPTEKINFFAQGGVEFRQGGGQNNNQFGQGNNQNGDTVNPIFSAGVGYAPFDSTSLTATAYQSVHSSVADSSQTVSTGVGLNASQRFFQRFFLNLSFTYSHNDDQSGTGGISTTAINTGGTTAGTSQDTFAYRPSLSFNPTLWTSVAVYYQYLDNQSNSIGANYHDNQLGISASVQF
jgi:hypothetical protein